MRNLLKVIGNAALVVGGFFLVLFGTSKVSNQSSGVLSTGNEGLGVAHADAAPPPPPPPPPPADSAGSTGSTGG